MLLSSNVGTKDALNSNISSITIMKASTKTLNSQELTEEYKNTELATQRSKEINITIDKT